MTIKKILHIAKWIVLIIGGIIMAVFAHKIIKKAIRGRVTRKLKFMPIIGRPNKIQVLNENGKVVTATLPKDMKYRKVAAAGIDIHGNVIVEAKKHEKVDRKTIANDPDYKPDPDGFKSGRKIND